jgi:hypothetical protein
MPGGPSLGKELDASPPANAQSSQPATHTTVPLSGGAAMGGMAAMSASAHGGAAGQMRDAPNPTAPQTRSDEERAKEARELLERLRSERDSGEGS